MFKVKYLVATTVLASLISCQSEKKTESEMPVREKTEREIEDEFVEKYAPTDLNTYGFTLPVDSKVAEVHQIFNEIEANFYFYGDKEEFERKTKEIIELDPNYPSAILMSGFYVKDPEEYKELVTKAYNLSKTTTLKSEQYIIQAEYALLVEEDYLKAQKFFQKVTDMYPGSAAAIWSLGMAYYYNDEIDKALACYKKSTELIPNLPKGYEFMSAMYYEKKDYKKALDYIELAKKYGALTKNDIYYAEYEHMVYYRNELYDKTMKSIVKAQTYGDDFKNSESLKKTYQYAKIKFDSIQAL